MPPLRVRSLRESEVAVLDQRRAQVLFECTNVSLLVTRHVPFAFDGDLWPRLELYLFHSDVRLIHVTMEAGAAGVVVDWEYRGKEERQAGFDTDIRPQSPEDLARVRAATKARVICRINPVGPWTRDEVVRALELGADEVLVPMVRSPAEVEDVLEFCGETGRVGIMLETLDAFRHASELAALPLSRVFVGLHDLAIERRIANPFRSLTDGMIDEVRPLFSCPFGLGGLTVPEGGYPIPCVLLLAELLRLRCNFTFMRRSFLRDVSGKEPGEAVRRILSAVKVVGRLVEECGPELHRMFVASVEESDGFFEGLNAGAGRNTKDRGRSGA